MELTGKWSVWSKLRVSLKFLYTSWIVLIAFIGITAYMVFLNVLYAHNHKNESAQRKYMIYASNILILGLWINMLLPIICNGEADIAKHMFLFTNCIDILFALGVIAVVRSGFKSAVKAVAIAKGFVAPSGMDLVCSPAFTEVKIDNEDKTGIKFTIEPKL